MRLSRLVPVLAAGILICGAVRSHAQSCVAASQVTLTGSLRNANGLPSSNSTIALNPSQQGFIAGCGISLQSNAFCYTSTDGSVVGLPNPVRPPIGTTTGSGTLPAGTYYTVISWYDAAGNTTLPSPELVTILSTAGALVISPPSTGTPAGAVGMNVYISTSAGAETLQGTALATNSYIRTTPLVSSTAPNTINLTSCKVTANDTIWPSGTGYIVSMTDSQGNAIPGYPMQWQLLGAGTTINLSNGLPYYHGVTTYPVPLLAFPQNHGNQSISGNLSLGGYNLLGAGKVGIGTSTPGWPLDVANGPVNAFGGYLVNGGAGTTGQCLASDGSSAKLWINCLTSATLFYQTVQSNGSPLTQRPALNFSPRFSLSDSASPAATIVELANSGVTAATYTNATVTVDQYGRVVTASNGSVPSNASSAVTITSGICTTGSSSYATCSFTATWGTGFVDSNYAVACSAAPPTVGVVFNLYAVPATATTFTVTLQNGTSSGAAATTTNSITCVGKHN